MNSIIINNIWKYIKLKFETKINNLLKISFKIYKYKNILIGGGGLRGINTPKLLL